MGFEASNTDHPLPDGFGCRAAIDFFDPSQHQIGVRCFCRMESPQHLELRAELIASGNKCQLLLSDAAGQLRISHEISLDDNLPTLRTAAQLRSYESLVAYGGELAQFLLPAPIRYA